MDSLYKIKMIHIDKVEELAEIKEDTGNEDSYIYKKVASSVRDIEERMETIEKQINNNKKVVSADFLATEEKKMKEKEKKWLIRRAEEKAEERAAKQAAKAARTAEKAALTDETKESNATDTEFKKSSSKSEKTELDKDVSIVSSALNIEATAETVAKLPKIPKLSAKKAADESAESGDTKDGELSVEGKTSKTSTKEASKIKSSKTEASSSSGTRSSSKSESKDERSRSASSSRGPITNEEIDQVLPYYQWCTLCKNFFESSDEFISHLHRDAHLNGLRTSDFGIIKRAEEKMDSQILKEEKKQTVDSNGTVNESDATNSVEIFGNEPPLHFN